MNKFTVNELNNYFPFEIEDLYSFIKTLRNKSETLEGMSKFLEETMSIKLIFQEENNFHYFLENFFPICQRVYPGREEEGEIVGVKINSDDEYNYQLINPTDMSIMWEYEKDITEPFRTLYKNVKVEYMEDRYEELSSDPFLNSFLERPLCFDDFFKL